MSDVQTVVQNFGQVESKSAQMKIVYTTNDKKKIEVANGEIYGLKPYEKTTVELKCGKIFKAGEEYNFIVIISSKNHKTSLLHGKITPLI